MTSVKIVTRAKPYFKIVPNIELRKWGNIFGDIEDQTDLIEYIASHSGESGTVQSIVSAASATPAATDIMVSVSALNENFILNAPDSLSDAKEFFLRITATGVFSLAFAPEYRFSNDFPVVSQTTADDTLYFHFIKNDVTSTLDCILIERNYEVVVIPPPPYIISSSNVIVIADYRQGTGPSLPSQGLAVFGLGLPGSGNGLLTPSENTEISEDSGVTYQSTPILIPFVSGAVTTPAKYRIRFKDGLTIGDYNEDVILSAPTAADFPINISVQVTSPFPSYDIDAANYLTAIGIPNDNTVFFPGTAYEIIGSSIWTFVNDHFLELKGQGTINTQYDLWAKMKIIYMYVGGSAFAHKINAKDPRDSDAAFRQVFTGGFTHDGAGCKGNGVNGMSFTKLIPLNDLQQSNLHFSCYMNTDAEGKYIMGIFQGSSFSYIRKSVFASDNGCNSNAFVSIVTLGKQIIYSRDNSASFRRTLDGVVDTITSSEGTLSNLEFYNFCINTGGASNYSDPRHVYDTVGDSLTSNESIMLYTISKDLQIKLNRDLLP